MQALIDADIFSYSFGSCKDDEGHPLAWPLVATRLNAQIKNIIERVGADTYQLYLTGDGNFRESVATIKPYKGTRPTEKPYWHEQVRGYLIKFRNAKVVQGWEADDQLAMDQIKNTEVTYPEGYEVTKYNSIICSLDKDLNMVPGLHYNWSKDEIYTITSQTGLHNFYCQLLTGDSVDNIPGLFGIGKSSTYLKSIRSFTDEWDMFNIVWSRYHCYFGSYAWQFMIENAQLLWMVRDETCEKKEMEIVHRLEGLRNQSTGQNWKKRLLNSFSETI